MKTYTYNPTKIKENGLYRMRFELGDTMVEGGAETCALTDEEINAVLMQYPDRWKKAKLALVESVLFRFSYEVDTKIGPLSLSLRGRVEAFKALRDELKQSTGTTPPRATLGTTGNGHPYFYAGMMENPYKGATEGSGHDVL